MNAIPDQDRVWRTWLDFLSVYGTISPDPDVGVSVSRPGHESRFLLSRTQLHDYVTKYIRVRRAHGFSDGLVDGLPISLTDSFGDCFGPQEAPYAEFVLEGEAFKPVPGSSPAEHIASTQETSEPQGYWVLLDGPEGPQEDQTEESARTTWPPF